MVYIHLITCETNRLCEPHSTPLANLLVSFTCLSLPPVLRKNFFIKKLHYLYKRDILTDMRKLLVTLDDDLDKVLAQYPNQNQIVREALKLYNGDITTDTIAGLRKSYDNLLRYTKSKHEYYDQVFARLDKLINVLETRI